MKKKVILLVVIMSVFIMGGVSLVIYNKNNNTKHVNKKSTINKKKNKDAEKKCISFTGGSFNIIFNNDEENEIPNMSVCIACSPDSYEDLPIPVKEGYNFDGWYYDKEFTKKIEITNTRDFRAVPEYDKNKCIIGYKDIEVYAKWSEVQSRIEENKDSNVITNNSNSSSNYDANSNINNPPINTDNNSDVSTVNNTRVHKPSDTGFVIDGYGYKSGYAISYLKIKTNGNGLLYPINDADVLVWSFNGNSNQYRYVLYKTVIDGKELYVMYFTYLNLIPMGDTYDTGKITREVSYNDPLVRLSFTSNSIDNYGMYRIKIAPIFSNDYNYVVRTMLMNNYNYTFNPSMILGIYEGDSFDER